MQPSALAAEPPTAGFGTHAVIGVRVAGVPVSDLDALRCPRTEAVLDEAVAHTRWLRAEGSALSDLLHPVIGRCADADRPLLVALRRAVFRGRRPTGRVWAARRALPPDLAARVERWATRAGRDVAAEVTRAVAEDRVAALAALRVAARRDAFRLALASASPDLTRAVAAWLDDPAAPQPGAGAVASLAKYLARAVAKPSPYSSFTLSGLGGWCDRGPAVTTSGDLDWLSVPEVERQAVLAVWSALAERLWDHVGLRVNPSVRPDGGRLWFLTASPGERVVSVAAAEAVLDVLRFVRATTRPTAGSLVRHLAGERDFVTGLIELGLLEPLRPFPDQSTDPFDHLARWVEAHDAGSPWPRRLRELRGQVAGYREPGTAAERVERARLVRASLDGLLTDLGREPWPAHRPVLLENSVLARPVVTCARNRWQPVLDDLDAVRGVLGAVDRSLGFKLRLAAFFRDRFGSRARVPFLALYREFRADPGPVGPRVDLRRAVLSALYGDSAEDVVAVDPQALAKLAAGLPAHVVAPRSVCCYGQELPGSGFVLNTVRTGYGWGVTRTEHLLRAAGVAVPDRTSAHPDVLLAECRAAFGSQLNQRARAVPYVLDHPGGEPPDGPALSPADLWVRHDPARGRLVLCDPGDRPVLPLALGGLVADLLPPALRFLVAVFGEPQTAFTLPDDVGWRPPVDGVARRPRLEVGRVVLGRAGWRVDAADLPADLPALAHWRDRHGVPRRCFARTAGRRDRARKPVYVDFASFFALSALPREGVVVFEEPLPDPLDAPHHGVHGQRVTELVFELSDRHG
ncbi:MULTISPECIES: lantibiotic dehydratase [Saccharothrix]|uniref:lantibiotic dehydratase n=1 Tax=Saccharothrix TaxID=2071 RepID=UPI00093A93AA|nr:lantibiotic dehydratase [Saccharothrix sp. CB00851]OKI16192.1 hypothetical protein A6A25_12955 [Saccharothrix sp. CB00851]